MPIPPRTQPILSRILTSERFEKLTQTTVKTAQRLRGLEGVVRFFHDPTCARSWLMAQALVVLQERYGITVLGHTITGPDEDYVRDLRAYYRFSLDDAKQQAAYYGLRAPDHAPDAQQVATVAKELFELEGDARWLQHAVHLGETLFCSNALTGVICDLSDLKRNDQLLQQLGNYRGGSVFAGGQWHFGVDRIAHLEALVAEEIERPALPAKPDALPPIVPPKTLRFYCSLRSPFSYLAYPRVMEICHRFGMELDVLPVAAPDDDRRDAPMRKQLDLLLDASREARRRGVRFGRVSRFDAQPRTQVASCFFAMDEAPEEQLAFVLAVFEAIWADGIDLNDPRNLNQLLRSHGISDDDAAEALRDTAWPSAGFANGEHLEARGLLDVPAFELGDQLFWGYDRLDYLEAQLQAGAAG